MNNKNSVDTKSQASPFSETDLEYFYNLIAQKRRQAMEQLEKIRDWISGDNPQELDSDSAYSFHMADSAAVSTDRERSYMLLERQQTLINDLERALVRIHNKTFGICRITGLPISRERLEAIPYTEISVKASTGLS